MDGSSGGAIVVGTSGGTVDVGTSGGTFVLGITDDGVIGATAGVGVMDMVTGGTGTSGGTTCGARAGVASERAIAARDC